MICQFCNEWRASIIKTAKLPPNYTDISMSTTVEKRLAHKKYVQGDTSKMGQGSKFATNKNLQFFHNHHATWTI